MEVKSLAHCINSKWRSEDVKSQEKADFTSLLLNAKVLAGLNKSGFKKPSPIQLEAIPVGRFGKDLIVQAKSGTGKTLVFTIVALEMLIDVHYPQVLILAPTREIAHQICSVIKRVGSEFNDLNCCTFIGGTLINEDREKAHDCQIAVGSPGRIKQLINDGVLKTNSIRLFVLDEADQLLTNTLLDDVDDIFFTLPKDKQVIATSATYSNKLKKLTSRYFSDPYFARLDVDKLALLGMTHYTYFLNCSDWVVLMDKQKLEYLKRVLTSVTFSQCLVFCNMVSKVKSLSSNIKDWGFSTASISSAKDQAARLQAIDKLKRFKCTVLVSSDLTSRGIDAENVDLVINFDVPISTEVYLHRAGRAGRYGSKAVTVTLYKKKDARDLRRIEREGNFKSYSLPEPIPANLINMYPEDLNQVEYTFSDDSENSSEDDKSKQSGQDNMNEKSDKRSLENNQLSISLNGELESSTAETKLLEATESENKIEIPLSDSLKLSDSSIESATSQSCIKEHSEFQNKTKILSSETPEAVKESLVNGGKYKGGKGKKKSKPKVELVNMDKTIEDISENSTNLGFGAKLKSQFLNEELPQTALGTQNTNVPCDTNPANENPREVDSDISHSVLVEAEDSSVVKAQSLMCGAHLLEIPSNYVESSNGQRLICSKDIAQLKDSLNEYYLRVLNSVAAENSDNTEVSVAKEDGTAVSEVSIENKSASCSTLQENQVVHECIDNTKKSVTKKHGTTISNVSTEKKCGSYNSLPENRQENGNEFGAVKETKHNSDTENKIPFKGEVIFNAKSSDDSSDSSSSCDSWKPAHNMVILERKFKEMVKESYKRKPPRNQFMPTLSASNVAQITANKSQAKRAIFIDSSSESVESNTTDEASSESSSKVDPSEIRSLVNGDTAKETDRISSEDPSQVDELVRKTCKKHSHRNRISAKPNKNITRPYPKKSLPKRGDESCDINKHEIQKPKHQGGSSMFNWSTIASKGDCRPKQRSRLSKNKFSHELTSNFSGNTTRNNRGCNSTFHNTSNVSGHQNVCCMGYGNVPHTNCSRRNSHFNEQYINLLPHCPHTSQCHFHNADYQSQMSRQWYDMCYSQLQCIQNACYAQFS